ncbi:hypothetical protein DYBT9623_03973 [Dyadobacter sp. CECT 9623]|uniref:Acyltransferase n=1 Tax=Dyadobacter linearis TaxID=2823330 RepID=A0ABM8UUG3_9BACT|nr:acyltransferase family protein [Dyadobacter sp. CECT 9623]CAG5072035.1 hypothetical protein DYBT9623_03973 [Dyadobacter sp. CECT 9623]
MIFGGLAFFAEDFVKIRRKKLFSTAGYLLLFGCLLGLNSQMKWPGIFTLIPVIGTFLIIITDSNESRILRSPAIQFLGKISYSLYLWHWPIYVIARYLGLLEHLVAVPAMMFLSIGLAYISFRFIESFSFESSKKIIIAMMLTAGVTLLISDKNLNKGLFKNETLLISNYPKTHLRERIKQFNTKVCFISTTNTHFNKEKCLALSTKNKNFLLLGDSHSAHLSQSMRNKMEQANINLTQASASGCMPILRKNGERNCSELMNYIFDEFLPKNAGFIDGVIISANWVNGIEKGLQMSDIHATITQLENLGLKVILLGQNETYIVPFASLVAREYEYGISLSKNFLEPHSAEANERLKREFSKQYIEIYDIEGIAKLSENHIPYMSDENHYTKYGADHVSNFIFADLKFQNFIGVGLVQPDLKNRAVSSF